jgi:hypothetical protein
MTTLSDRLASLDESGVDQEFRLVRRSPEARERKVLAAFKRRFHKLQFS